MSTDPRLQYIARLASAALDLTHDTVDQWPSLVTQSICSFINDSSLESLRLYKTDQGLGVSSENNDDAICFVRRHPGKEIPSHQVHQHIVSTTFQGEDGLEILFQHLHRDQNPGSNYAIAAIDDEIRQCRKQEPVEAGQRLPLLESLKERLSAKWESEEDTRTALEDVEMVLGDLWRDRYPQSRITSLIQAASGRLASYIQESFASFDLFTGPWQAVRQQLGASQRIVDFWQLILQDLYQRELADRWQGEWIDDDLLSRVSRRLRHLNECRGLHEELKRLIPVSDHERLGVPAALHALAQANPLHWSAASDATWNQGLARFDRDINPIEHHACLILKQRLQSAAANAALILAELEQFPELLSRPLAGDDLASERDHLLVVTGVFVQELCHQFESSAQQSCLGQNLTPVASRIIWATQISTRCRQARDAVDRILYGLQGLERFLSQCDQLLERIRLFCDNQVQAWLDAIQAELASPSSTLRLQASGHLVDFDLEHDGDMRVHYDERLLTLMRDVRVLSEFGYRMPADVDAIVACGDQFYRYAAQLQQVAQFYNTMSDQIIPSQKAMLLADAHAFEVAVQNASPTWSDSTQMGDYVANVMQAAERLTRRNRRLRVVHEAIGNEVRDLLCADVTGPSWAQILSRVAGVISLQEKQYGGKGVEIWRRHWDQQIYKVLRAVYGRTLSSWTPPSRVSCQLVFDKGRLGFDPGLEEIRLTLTRNLKKLISVPVTITCLDPSPESRQLFCAVPARFTQDIACLFAHVESMCADMKDVAARYQDWVVPALVDVKTLFAIKFANGSAQDFAQSLADVDSRMMEIGGLQDRIDLTWVSISLAAFKQSVRQIGRDLAHAIRHQIADVIQADLFERDQFTQRCQTVIESRPKSSSEIMAARATLLQLLLEKSAFSFDRLEELNQLLSSSEHVVDLGLVRQRWSGLDQSLRSFEDVLQNCSKYCRDTIAMRTRSLNSNIDKFHSRWTALRPTQGAVSDHDAVLTELSDWVRDLDQIRAEVDDLTAESRVFELAPPDIALDLLEASASDLSQLRSVWSAVDEFQREFARLADAEPWIELRSHPGDIGAFCHRWTEKLSTMRIEMVMAAELRADLQRLDQVYSSIRYLTGDYFQKDHWSAFIHILSLPGAVNLQSLRLRHLLQGADQIQARARALRDLHSRAQGEVSLREAFDEIRTWSETCEFDLIGDGGDVLVRGWDQIQSEIGDKLAFLTSLRDSAYFAPFLDQAQHLQRRFQLLDSAITKLGTIQRRWVYLAPIFIRGALPKEQGRFQRIDEEFRSIMEAIKANRNVMALGNMVGLEDRLGTMVDQLERCQKALSEFLEQKRSQFPRFYFIGDDSLLEILGQSANPAVVQTHLKKLFQGIDRVEFDRESIVAMVSAESEVVPLLNPIDFTTDVDRWLSDLCHQMKATLQHLLVAALDQGRLDLDQYPGQILALANEIQFTTRVECALEHNGTELAQIARDVQARLSELTRDHGDRIRNIKARSLIVDLAHQLDLVEMLRRNEVRSASDWRWQKQLRFYLNDNQRCWIRQSSSHLAYSYEYQGNAARLVHTALTNKCYLVLTTGIHLGSGGNPYGPAGTGKTESVKALGHALGRQVVVFNCDDGIDAQSMGRIFTGLVKSGAWGCFDEFNRLRQDQLSAVSQQIQVIQSALKTGQASVRLLNAQVEVHPDAGVFVTMNPAGKEYGGRSRLPDNLKALFRPIAMTAPDFGLIAQVMLYSSGFNHGHELGPKLVSIYELAKQLLSHQRHYDWGLRSFKSVLNTAARLLGRHDSNLSVEKEAETLVKALASSTISKITNEDVGIFRALIRDVFPQIDLATAPNASLRESVLETFTRLGLQAIPEQVDKVVQLESALTERMGVVLFGPSGSGKSTLIRVLAGALGASPLPIHVQVMNPKALDRHGLLGYMDADTRVWTDGVLTRACRKVLESDSDQRHWIICDGDVDPEWIESLNSVLDDNHLLTLPNGERLQFRSNVNFIFETDDLRHASPATISRMGMVLVGSDPDDLADALISAWRRRIQSDAALDLIDSILIPVLRFQREARLGDTVLKTNRVSEVGSIFSQVAGCTSPPEFALGLMRALSANRGRACLQPLFAEIMRVARLTGIDPGVALDLYFDSESQSLRPFQLRSSEQDGQAGGRVLVETVLVQRQLSIVAPWMRHREPILLLGPEGAGKSTLIDLALKSANIKSSATLHCSAQTRPAHIVEVVQSCCQLIQSGTGPVLRPSGGDEFVLVVSDLGLLCRDPYGSISAICFLTHLLEFSGFYSANQEFIAIDNMTLICTATRVEATASLSPRFTSRLRILNIEFPPESDLHAIYQAYLQPAVDQAKEGDGDGWSDPGSCSALSHTLVQVYQGCVRTFTADQYPHYRFTPRQLTSCCSSLIRYDLAREPLLNAFVHELQRTFRDRLVTDQCRSRFDALLASVVTSSWSRFQSPQADVVYSSLSRAAGDQVFARVSLSDATSCLVAGIRRYEQDHGHLDIDVFPNMILFCCRIDQALCQKSRSLLLFGSTGIGRRSAVSLIAYIRSYRLFIPNPSRSYSAQSLQNDVKDWFKVCAVDGEQVVVLMEHYGLVQESLMSIVCTILSSGYVLGLFTQAELEPILVSVRESAADVGVSAMQYFVDLIRSNLHLVICLDPSHPDYKSHCLQHPVLLDSCHIIWNTEWSRDDASLITRTRLQSDLPGHDVDQVAGQLVKLYDWASQHHHTPRKYMALLATYCRVHQAQMERMQSKRKYLSMGLSKLADAEQLVEELSSTATKKSAALQEKQFQADAALQSITGSMSTASDRRLEVQALQASLADKEEKLKLRKAQVEKELAEINPVLEHSREAVGSIKKEALAEMRALRMPPEAVHDVLSGVLMLMGIEDTSWNSMKRLLASTTFKDEIVQFDAHKITGDVRDRVQSLLKKKEASFEHKNIYRVNTAAAPLAAWVLAQIRYAQVLERIAPLEADLKAADDALSGSRLRLESCVQELGDLDRQVIELQQSFARMTSDAAALRFELQAAQDVLGRASTLMSKLQDEKVRWSGDDDDLCSRLSQVSVQAILSSGLMCYLSHQDEERRRDTLRRWTQLYQVEDPFDMRRFLSSESELIVWKEHGINMDPYSVENALTIVSSPQPSFIIDPTMSVAKWLQMVLQKRAIESLNQNDARFVAVVELAVRFGKALIIHDVDGVESTLYPVIKKQLIRQGPRWVVPVADKTVDYNDDFALYLITRNENCRLAPDAHAIVNVVNFTVTKSGLESQLLGIAIQQDEPELEQKKSKLIADEETMKLELHDLEKNILETLATSHGNLLENVALIESLRQIKTRSGAIAVALERSAAVQNDLDVQRRVYLPVARIGAEIYFTWRLLPHVNSMYRFSQRSLIEQFVDNFQQSLPAPTADKPSRVSFYTRSLVHRLFRFAAQSIFKQDRLMLAMQLCRALYPDLCSTALWATLIGSSVTASDAVSLPSWVPADRHAALLNVIAAEPSFHPQILQDPSWTEWMALPCAERHPLPPSCRSLSSFQRLMLIMALRPDRSVSAMTDFACQTLQLTSLSPPPASVDDCMALVPPSSPVLFISSPGVDPSRDIQESAKSRSVELVEIAMSPEQRPLAIEAVRQGANTGAWVCLKNIHLVADWLPQLEQALSSTPNHHDTFRLWLIAESHSELSPMLLEMSLKLTVESPPGIKRNLLSTYSIWSSEYVGRGSADRARLLFLLAWFHAVIQERRTFLPQGWSKFYEFSPADLRSASVLLDEICEQSERIPWPRVVGVLQDGVYGGRIDHPYDDLVLQTYLQRYFADDSDPRLGLSPPNQLPQSNLHGDYVKLIRSLPEHDSPAVFGLPGNIDASVQRQTGSLIVAQLRQLHHVTVLSSQVGFDAERWRELLSPLFNLQLKYQTGRGTAPAIHTSDRNLNPTAAFLIVEDQNAAVLIDDINRCLNDLKRVTSGATIITQALLEDGLELIRGQVPNRWATLWSAGPIDVLRFAADAFARKAALSAWLAKSLSNSLFASPLSLSDLFYPTTFLNAFRQESARMTNRPIDALKLSCVWERSRLPSNSVLVLQLKGLWLQGAEFVAGQVSESGPQSQAMAPLPICYVTFSEGVDPSRSYQSISMPLYADAGRTACICELRLPCSSNQHQWILAGVAILLSNA